MSVYIRESQKRAKIILAGVIIRGGMRVKKQGWWVYVCSTDRLTHYAAHPSRGRAGLDAIGIAPRFHGTSVHDGLKSYQGYAFTEALCNVHHLRELTFVEEELKQPWAKAMKELLLDMKAKVEQARIQGQYSLEVPILAELLRRYEELLTQGYRANPPPPPPKKLDHNKRKPGRAKQSPARNPALPLLYTQAGRAALSLRFCCAFR